MLSPPPTFTSADSDDDSTERETFVAWWIVGTPVDIRRCTAKIDTSMEPSDVGLDIDDFVSGDIPPLFENDFNILLSMDGLKLE